MNPKGRASSRGASGFAAAGQSGGSRGGRTSQGAGTGASAAYEEAGSELTDEDEDEEEDEDEVGGGGGGGSGGVGGRGRGGLGAVVVESGGEESASTRRCFAGHSPRSDVDEDEEEDEEEDSSDMDAQDCDKKRYDFIDDLSDLEKQFSILREQLYRERITQIEQKLMEVNAGKAPEYLQPLEELQVNMRNRLEVGRILRELRIKNIQCKYEAEQLAAQQNFESEKALLWDSIRSELEEHIHMLEEDKNNVDFNAGLWEQTSFRSKKRKADPMDPDRRKKPVTVSGPFIVYMLPEADILEDWAVIKKAMAHRRKPDLRL